MKVMKVRKWESWLDCLVVKGIINVRNWASYESRPPCLPRPTHAGSCQCRWTVLTLLLNPPLTRST